MRHSARRQWDGWTKATDGSVISAHKHKIVSTWMQVSHKYLHKWIWNGRNDCALMDSFSYDANGIRAECGGRAECGVRAKGGSGYEEGSSKNCENIAWSCDDGVGRGGFIWNMECLCVCWVGWGILAVSGLNVLMYLLARAAAFEPHLSVNSRCRLIRSRSISLQTTR